ncbi:MAG: hypothetical protein ACLUNO_09510 [Oscillospiraceae bacterium]
MPGCTLTDTAKLFAELGGTVLIWPDKIWFRPADGTFGSAEPSWTGTVTLGSSDDTGDAGRANVLQADGAGTRFRVGDAVTLSGFGDARNNGTYILRGIDGAKLIFDPDTFVRAGTVSGVTITRRLPDAQHACSYGNRLWACAHDTVWCTKLGDPLSWFWYEADENGAVATAAWSVDVGAPGDFSGCAATGSGVVFQAGGALAAVRHAAGQLPARGLGRARCRAGLRPHARDGSGDALLSLPRRAGAHGGRTADAHRRHARAHALGRSGGHGRHTLVSLGARREKRLAPVRIRHAQRPVEPRGRFSRARLARRGGALYAQDARGVWRFGTGSTAQMQSLLETGDFVSGSPDCKRLLRVQLRLEAEAGASITAAVQYDSDGQWHTLAAVTAGAKRSVNLPVLPRRCDHFRLRLTGTGAWRLLSLTRTETAAGPQH